MLAPVSPPNDTTSRADCVDRLLWDALVWDNYLRDDLLSHAASPIYLLWYNLLWDFLLRHILSQCREHSWDSHPKAIVPEALWTCR